MQKRVAWIWNRKREILSTDTTRHEGGENGWSFHLFLYSTLTKQWTESLGFHVPTEKKEKKKKEMSCTGSLTRVILRLTLDISWYFYHGENEENT